MARAEPIIRSGNRIAEALLARRQAESHLLELLAMNSRRDRVLSQQSAPGNITSVEMPYFGQALLPHRRTQAIGANEHAGLYCAAVAEASGNALRVLFEDIETDTAVIVLRRERIAQHAISALP